MRLRAVARVAARSDDVALTNAVAHAHSSRPLLQMRQENERALGALPDHDVVAGDRRRATPKATCLTKHVGQKRQLRPSRLMVDLAVMDDHDLARAGRQDRGTEPDETPRVLRGHRGPPAPRCRAALFVHGHQIDRIGRAHQVGAVTGDPPRWTVAGEKPPPQWIRQDDRSRGGGSVLHGPSLAQTMRVGQMLASRRTRHNPPERAAARPDTSQQVFFAADARTRPRLGTPSLCGDRRSTLRRSPPCGPSEDLTDPRASVPRCDGKRPRVSYPFATWCCYLLLLSVTVYW